MQSAIAWKWGKLRGERFLDLTDSANLYLTQDQARLYRAATVEPGYSATVLSAVKTGVEEAAGVFHLLAKATDEVAVIDLGLGSADIVKSRYELLGRHLSIREVVAVDVNAELLRGATRALSQMALGPISGLNSKFTDALELRLHAAGLKKLIVLGSSCFNLSRTQLQRVISRLAEAGDLMLLQFLLHLPGAETSRIAAPYRSAEIASFVFEPIRLLGGRREDFTPHIGWESGCIAFDFVTKRGLALGAGIGEVQPACKVRTGFSRRPRLEALFREVGLLASEFHVLVGPSGIATVVGAAWGRGGGRE